MNIKQFLYQKYISCKNHVTFGKNCLVNRKNIFEGHNALINNNKIANSYIGYGSYIANNTNINFTKIGRFCAIGDHVRTGLGRHPAHTFVSIHPAFFSTKKQSGFTFTQKNIFEEHKYVDSEKKYFVEIGNDVWIGNNVLILDGIKIFNGAIIAAGAIVTKDVPPYSIVGGVPAKVIGFRFEKDQIDFLLNFKWWERDFQWLQSNAIYFQNIVHFINKFNK